MQNGQHSRRRLSLNLAKHTKKWQSCKWWWD